MTEVLANLPAELKNKVFTYNSHPVADLFRKEVLPGMTACTMCMEALQEHFPNLTRRDMHVPVGEAVSEDYDQTCMSLLYCALFLDEHRTVSLLVLKKWKEALEAAGEEVDPHWFFHFLTTFFMQHNNKWENKPVAEFYQWVEENCEFSFVDE